MGKLRSRWETLRGLGWDEALTKKVKALIVSSASLFVYTFAQRATAAQVLFYVIIFEQMLSVLRNESGNDTTRGKLHRKSIGDVLDASLQSVRLLTRCGVIVARTILWKALAVVMTFGCTGIANPLGWLLSASHLLTPGSCANGLYFASSLVLLLIYQVDAVEDLGWHCMPSLALCVVAAVFILPSASPEQLPEKRDKVRSKEPQPDSAPSSPNTTSEDMIISFDSQYHILSVNKATTQLLEWKEKDLINQPASVLFASTEQEAQWRMCWNEVINSAVKFQPATATAASGGETPSAPSATATATASAYPELASASATATSASGSQTVASCSASGTSTVVSSSSTTPSAEIPGMLRSESSLSTHQFITRSGRLIKVFCTFCMRQELPLGEDDHLQFVCTARPDGDSVQRPCDFRNRRNSLSAHAAHAEQCKSSKATTLLDELKSMSADYNAEGESCKSRISNAHIWHTMCHEIRTPLSGMVALINLLSQEDLCTPHMDLVRTIRQSGEILLSVVHDILDFTKLDSKNLLLHEASFDLELCVETVCEVLAMAASEKGVEVVCFVDPAMPRHVIGDAVMLNLVNNAIKFTPRGGTVVVELQSSSGLEESLSKDHHKFAFSVSDTGIGIPENCIEQIFHPFIQLDSRSSRVYGGTGLGLAICERLVSLMGGAIKVKSKLGEGSVFIAEFELLRKKQSTRKGSISNQTNLLALQQDLHPPVEHNAELGQRQSAQVIRRLQRNKQASSQQKRIKTRSRTNSDPLPLRAPLLFDMEQNPIVALCVPNSVVRRAITCYLKDYNKNIRVIEAANLDSLLKLARDGQHMHSAIVDTALFLGDCSGKRDESVGSLREVEQNLKAISGRMHRNCRKLNNRWHAGSANIFLLYDARQTKAIERFVALGLNALNKPVKRRALIAGLFSGAPIKSLESEDVASICPKYGKPFWKAPGDFIDSQRLLTNDYLYGQMANALARAGKDLQSVKEKCKQVQMQREVVLPRMLRRLSLDIGNCKRVAPTVSGNIEELSNNPSDTPRQRSSSVTAETSKDFVPEKDPRSARTTPSSPIHGTTKVSDDIMDVLIVEDNLVNQKILMRMLGKYGIRYQVAGNGKEAVEEVQRHRYDLILMDCMMPIMDGYEATKQIRDWENTHSGTRQIIVALTANSHAGDRERCVGIGMDEYIQKPVTTERLLKTLWSFLPTKMEKVSSLSPRPQSTAPLRSPSTLPSAPVCGSASASATASATAGSVEASAKVQGSGHATAKASAH